MNSAGQRFGTLSQLLSSDIVIVFLMVLLLLILVIVTLCWMVRRRGNQPSSTGRLAEIEITSRANLEGSSQPRFALKIVTEQRHISELVEMLMGCTGSGIRFDWPTTVMTSLASSSKHTNPSETTSMTPVQPSEQRLGQETPFITNPSLPLPPLLNAQSEPQLPGVLETDDELDYDVVHDEEEDDEDGEYSSDS